MEIEKVLLKKIKKVLDSKSEVYHLPTCKIYFRKSKENLNILGPVWSYNSINVLQWIALTERYPKKVTNREHVSVRYN